MFQKKKNQQTDSDLDGKKVSEFAAGKTAALGFLPDALKLELCVVVNDALSFLDVLLVERWGLPTHSNTAVERKGRKHT